MAKRRKTHQGGGPYVATAVFCERVLTERDGVPSLIRVVDRFTLAVPPGQKPPPFQVFASIILKAGFMRGRYTLTIKHRPPSGNIAPDLVVPVLFEGEDRGVGINAQMNFAALEEGLHWFDLVLEGQTLTSMPLRVIHLPAQMQASTSPDA
jgi:hypothetical protein